MKQSNLFLLIVLCVSTDYLCGSADWYADSSRQETFTMDPEHKSFHSSTIGSRSPESVQRKVAKLACVPEQKESDNDAQTDQKNSRKSLFCVGYHPKYERKPREIVKGELRVFPALLIRPIGGFKK